MVFTDKNKTNWKYILIVVVLAAIVAAGLFWFLTRKEALPLPFFEYDESREADEYIKLEESEEQKEELPEEAKGFFVKGEAKEVVFEYAQRIRKSDFFAEPDFEVRLDDWISENLSDLLTYRAMGIIQNPDVYRRIKEYKSMYGVEIIDFDIISETSIRFETREFEPPAYKRIAFFPTEFIVVEQGNDYLIDDIIVEERIELNEIACDRIEEVAKRDNCYANLAVIDRNLSLCEKIVTDREKGRCYRWIAVDEEWPALCTDITNLSQKEKCFSEYAAAWVDISWCDKMDDLTQKDRCYIDFAARIGNAAICREDITHSERKDICYYEVALSVERVAICEAISGTEIRASCFAHFSE